MRCLAHSKNKIMKTRAVRIYGKNDLRLEEFELPDMQDDEILAHVISDSICMSSYKAAKQGSDHKRIPDDIHINPTMIGHEFCGEIISVGKKWKSKFQAGSKFSIQPAMNYKGSLDAPGYSYRWIGGDATYVIIPNEVMEMDCLLEYTGDGYFMASLSEPMSCIIGAFNASYHTVTGSYVHHMGVVDGGNMAILAGGGAMGFGAIDYALHGDRRPGLLVITDTDSDRLQRAESIYPVSEAARCGVKLLFVNTRNMADPAEFLISLTGGKGYDDVFVFAPVRVVTEQADRILGRDGCLNFFAGPTNPDFKAEFNFFNVHYASTHVVGTSGGNTDDMIESLRLMAKKAINPAVMITHIGGLDAVIPTTLHLPEIPGGKKLIYTNIDMELTAITDFAQKGIDNDVFKELDRLVQKYNGLWNTEAEKYLLENHEKIATV
jgi:threonine dehydrogenase-like Zn-dependent dehydrogenase